MKSSNNISITANAISMRPWCPVMPVVAVDCIAIIGGYDYIRPGTIGFVVNKNNRDMS